ncbi:MAG TPA: WYL domain-containing protein [Gemmatimonadaceae bacterium]|nr:WYL domain-containing protein [Gemmatimonadaceae bacterium]
MSTALAQLRRLLAFIPEIADGQEHSVADVARRLGVDAETITRDLHALSERFGDPPGWIEKVQVYLESERVAVAAASHFKRPMRLMPEEVAALELGLTMLRTERPSEHAAIDAALARIHSLVTPDVSTIADVQDVQASRGTPNRTASLGVERNLAYVPVLREALRNHKQVAIHYRKAATSGDAERRAICPLSFAVEKGMWYLVAHCERSQGIRIFRVDRIEGIELLTESFEPPIIDVDKLLADGTAFVGSPPRTLRVRYSPRVARWIAEREQGTRLANGSFEVEYPLADTDWAVRHALQYGPEAEVIEPAEVRVAIVERLQRAANSAAV